MQTPRQWSALQFLAALEPLLTGTCPQCSDGLKTRAAFISIHSLEFGDACAGQGRCLQLMIPYCPRCEPVPEGFGCIHARLFTP
ncbi:MAG TPA: hypothetical protein VGP83_17230 [Pyrinomonadaceae bacterium]|jgi:hypothetical protein|nr:hypothetical protein [Pyrinomonadaceae bacterium]